MRIDVSLTISPIKDASGKMIAASTIAREFTERKLAEKNLLIAELDHRIRNTLMIITSLIGQTVKTTESPEASRTCVRVNIPENAHLDYTGTDWDCNRPYRKLNDKCVSMEDQQF